MDEGNRDVAIRAVVFDIGGILEITLEGGDPTSRFPLMIARWETQLGMPPGGLERQISEMQRRLKLAGKDGATGTFTEADLVEELRRMTGCDQPTLDALMRDHWDTYCGNPNSELAAYLVNLRPRYQTACLSNSFDGARREEEQRLHLSQITDLVIYSHEVGMAKPDPRIFALTCERLGRQPEEVVFLDDSEGHVAATMAFGIHAIRFHDNAQTIAAIQHVLQAHAG